MSMNDTPGGGGGYGDGSARAYGTGDGGAGGMGGRRSHARSASHGGIMITHQPHLDQGHAAGTMPVGVGGLGGTPTSSGGGGGSSGGGYVKGHQRAFSHGQLVEGGRGHRRAGSRTDFILPEGHEQRTREREQQHHHHKKTLSRSSSFPKGHSRQASRSESIYTIRQHKRTLKQKIMFWKKVPEESRTRVVVANHVVPPHVSRTQHPNGSYPDNRICTTKYTILSFLPKNLFEQFHRFANLYFLFIVLLNFVPAVNAFGKEVAMLPLIFVLGITAIKDAFEDRRRWHSDNRVNNATCRVYNRDQGRYVKTKWKHVKVGDIIHLSCNETIPADMVVLNSSDEYGMCFIESSNLDGESNLKQRQAVKGLGMDERFEVSKFDYMMEIGAPSTKIYHFTGTIPLPSGERVPLTKDNLLLRDCALRNTDYIEGIVVYAGRETKAMLNNGGTRYKRSKLERRMNIEVIWCVVILFLMCLISAAGSGLWQSSYEVNATLGMVPFIPPESLTATSSKLKLANKPIWVGFISFWTFVIIYQVIIPISLYVTIEVIKLMQVYHIHNDKDFKDKKSGKTIECRALNIPEELGQVEYVFTDKTGTLTENNMVFQRCSINGTDYPHTPVIISKEEKKSDQRDTFTLNNQLQEDLASIELPMIYAQPGSRQNPSSITPSKDSPSQRIIDFFFTLAACNTVIVAKYPHHDQMNASGMIVPNESANNSSISEVDNTSFNTTTSSIGSTSWAPNRLLRGLLSFSRPLSPIASSPRSTPPLTPEASPRYSVPPARHTPPSVSITLNPISHSNNLESVQESPGSIHPSANSSPTRPSLLNIQAAQMYNSSIMRETRSLTPSPMDIKPIYEAESPDELALVDAAYKYGCRLLRRSLHNILVSLPGYGLREYEVLHVLPFDSNRKRMSIIVRDPETQEKVLYCKGADSAILDNLSRAVDDKTKLRIFRTQQHLNIYSKKGLRVLCMAKRVLTEPEYEDWAMKHKEAENALSNRERKLQDSYLRIEKNLSLIGATGIEDRLQDGVPETIKAMRNAGIVVWVLTGDKQETAVNIAYSCALFSSDMEILKLNARTKDQADRTIQFYTQQIEQQEEAWQRQQLQAAANGSIGTSRDHPVEFSNLQNRSNQPRPPKERGLVVDGRTLIFILDRRANLKKAFLNLAGKCSAVLCCRATPLQKSLIVRSAKDSLKVLTLAVGDGANDVPMIQTADVGVGISGLEGKQAVMASDYAIARFKHLEKLLLVHGHWCYDRLSRIILYFFYKNASFVMILLCYQLYTGFSGSSMIDQMYLMVFNLLFTSIPPIIVGIYDQDAPAEVLLSQPQLYAQGRESRLYKSHSFWINIVDAIYQAIVLFFFAAVLHEDSDAGMYEFGLTITHATLVAQLLHLSIETKSWTIIHVFGIVVSLLIFYGFGVLYTMTCVSCFGSPSQFGELSHAIQSPIHWLTIMLTSILAVLPRFVVRSLSCSLNPDDITQVLIENRRSKRHDFMTSWSRSTSSSSVYRPNYEAETGDEASEPLSSMVTTTTVLTTTEEAEV
ncbi:phospholipid-transporting ATPase VA-like isoform X1 [Penaeus japonicus]|uniref:phospholipid-transporting ATPase VA-like isoform X1 n=1 Tax=Penaeus japonicus TaxID=27405 RepID=UPI001C714196|nr:phospholipid-transporting ATPase VA-like isoform X1 [Penaeus japonicus]